MKQMIRYSLLSVALTLSASVAAHAHSEHVPRMTAAEVAPEVDPSLAISGFALLAGALTVVRARRRSA